jgi:hypothetical protein
MESNIIGKRPVGKPRKRWVNAVLKNMKLEKRISRQASLEASFKEGQCSISGCLAIEENEDS